MKMIGYSPKVLLGVYFTFINFSIFGQNDKGIQFIRDANWQLVLDKAENENKYIFVDCFATWCGPCKAMEETVFRDTTLGFYMSKTYLSVRLQMDSTSKDNEHVKNWYPDAKKLMVGHDVKVFPTYLFFSSDGKLIHRVEGYIAAAEFIKTVIDATHFDMQEYSMYRAFDEGKLPISQVPGLISSLKKNREYKLADSVATKYIHDFIFKLPDTLMFTKENLSIMAGQLNSSGDIKLFNIFYQNGKKVDSIVRKGYSKDVLMRVINREEIYPKLFADSLKMQRPLARWPDWSSMTISLKEKYLFLDLSYINEYLLWAKRDYYKVSKQWPALATTAAQIIESLMFSEDNSPSKMMYAEINQLCWAEILGIADKITTGKAIIWMKHISDNNPNNRHYLDTYANLVFYGGQKEKALLLEAKALALKPDDKDIALNLKNMKEGKPNWEIRK